MPFTAAILSGCLNAYLNNTCASHEHACTCLCSSIAWHSAPDLSCCSSAACDVPVLRPAHALYFAAYEASKEALGGNVGSEYHPLATSAAGVSAALVNDTCMVPVDVVKQRLQVRLLMLHLARHTHAHQYIWCDMQSKCACLLAPADTLCTSEPCQVHGRVRVTSECRSLVAHTLAL